MKSYKIGDCRKLVALDYSSFSGKDNNFFTPLQSDNYVDENIRYCEEYYKIPIIKDKTVCSKLIRTMYCES